MVSLQLAWVTSDWGTQTRGNVHICAAEDLLAGDCVASQGQTRCSPMSRVQIILERSHRAVPRTGRVPAAAPDQVGISAHAQ